MPKKFFYVCAGLFLLALSYHVGALRADAQAPSNSVVALDYGGDGSSMTAITAIGDVYRFYGGTDLSTTYRGNIFGAPTATTSTTWGAVKDRYRK